MKEILLKESFRDLVEFTRNKSNCKSIDKIRKGFEALDRLNNLKPKIPQDSQFIKDKKKQITKVPALDSSFVTILFSALTRMFPKPTFAP